MPWHGPRGKCGCCKPCACPDGGNLTPQFINSPTVKVVIAGVPASFTFEYGSSTTYITNTLTNMDCMNGTYFYQYARNTSNGCVNWNAVFSYGRACTINWNVIQRTLSGSTGCYISSSTVDDIPVSYTLGVDYLDFGPGKSGWTSGILSRPTFGNWAIQGRADVECKHGYDASLSTRTFSVGIEPFGFVAKNISEQKIWLSHWPNSSDRCVPTYDTQRIEIGTMLTEVVDI